MLQAYVDGELGASSRVILEQHVGDCDACGTQLRAVQGGSAFLFESFSEVRLERDLTEHTLGHLPEMEHPEVDVVGLNLRTKHPSRWRERMVRLVPVAAAVLLVVLAAIMNKNWPAASLPSGTIGIVSHSVGDVSRIAQGSTERDAAPATTLTQPGDRYETAANGTMMLTLLGPTEVRIAANTRIRVHDDRKLSVEKGRVFLDVAHGDRLFNITTPTGDITVFGTSFDVWVESERTTVVVQDGEVQLGHAEDAGVFRIVEPGRGASVTARQRSISTRPENVPQVTAWAKHIVADAEAEAIFTDRIAPLQIPTQVAGQEGFYLPMGAAKLDTLLIEWKPTSAFAEYCDYNVFVSDSDNEPLFQTEIAGWEFGNPAVTQKEIQLQNVDPRHMWVRVVPVREDSKREVTISGVSAF